MASIDVLPDDPLAAMLQRVVSAAPPAGDGPRIQLRSIAVGDALKEREIQAEARKKGVALMRIGMFPGGLAIGPLLMPGQKGCFTCLAGAERKNNDLRKNLDRLDYPEIAGLRGMPARPPAFDTLAVAALAAALAEWATSGGAGTLSHAYLHMTYDPDIGSRRHIFAADPECPHCGDRPDDCAALGRLEFRPRPKPEPREYRSHNPAIDLPVLERELVDWRSGFVRSVFQNTASSLLPIVAAEVPMLDQRTPDTGYGRTKTFGGSRKVAVLESLERYSGRRPRGKRTVVRSSFADAGVHAVDPRRFTLHGPEQATEPGYGLSVYDDDLVYSWVWAHSVRHDKAVLVPEQLAFHSLIDRPGLPVNRFVSEISNGCAMGSSIEEAVYYGLLEVIERDAYLTSWYGRLPGIELDLETAEDPAIAAVCERCRAIGFEVHAFDVGLEFGVPAIQTMIIDTAKDAPMKSYCAAGAHTDPEAAVFGGLVEVITSMALYKETFPEFQGRARELLADLSKVQSVEDHIILFSNAEMLSELGYLFAGGKVALKARFPAWYGGQPPGDLMPELAAIFASVLQVADDILIVDQTSDLLRRYGLSCVKVLAPGLSTVTFGHQYRRIPSERVARARTLPRFRGFSLPKDINVLPHNFP